MPQASFYFNVASQDQALCQLVSKALARKLAIGVLTASPADSQRYDRLLWEVPTTGFLPHCAANDALAGQTPILLDEQLDRLPARDVLFNLSGHALPADQRFARLIEIVARGDEAGRHAARQRVQQYRQAGFEVDFTDMAQISHG